MHQPESQCVVDSLTASARIPSILLPYCASSKKVLSKSKLAESKYGFVMNSYSKTILSANKFSIFSSRDCVPLVCYDSDNDSGYIPENLRKVLFVNDGIDLFYKLRQDNYHEINHFVQKEFNEYKSVDFYDNIFSKYLC